MHDYKKLKIWKESVSFAVEVYALTATFLKEEMYGLISQLRRASVSVPSNIAEGSKRTIEKDFRSFLSIALGSCVELETQLFISKEIGYLDENKYLEVSSRLSEIIKMTTVFSKNIST